MCSVIHQVFMEHLWSDIVLGAGRIRGSNSDNISALIGVGSCK
jgi:hypothetical protein